MKSLFAVIASGDLVSGTIDARAIPGIRGIHVPGVVSGDLLIQGALDSSSGSFARLLDTRAAGSGDLRFATGPGSRFIPIPHGLQETFPPYLRLEAAAAQTSPATLTLLTRT